MCNMTTRNVTVLKHKAVKNQPKPPDGTWTYSVYPETLADKEKLWGTDVVNSLADAEFDIKAGNMLRAAWNRGYSHAEIQNLFDAWAPTMGRMQAAPPVSTQARNVLENTEIIPDDLARALYDKLMKKFGPASDKADIEE